MSGPGDRFTRGEGADWLTDYFARMMPDAEKWLDEQDRLRAQLGGDPAEPDGGALPLVARKLVSYIEVPDELLMDAGLIPDTRPPRPPLPWRHRLRSKVSDWRERAARRAYKIVAGDWPDDREDW